MEHKTTFFEILKLQTKQIGIETPNKNNVEKFLWTKGGFKCIQGLKKDFHKNINTEFRWTLMKNTYQSLSLDRGIPINHK